MDLLDPAASDAPPPSNPSTVTVIPGVPDPRLGLAIASHMAAGLTQIHGRGVLLGDFKSLNVLVFKSKVWPGILCKVRTFYMHFCSQLSIPLIKRVRASRPVQPSTTLRNVAPFLSLFKLKPLKISQIADFGTSRFRDEAWISGNQRVTRIYLSPELLAGGIKEITEAGDMYAFGMVLWELAHPDWMTLEAHATGQGQPGTVISVPTPLPLAELMGSCLNPDPNGRPKIAAANAAIRGILVSCGVRFAVISSFCSMRWRSEWSAGSGVTGV